MDLKSLRQHYRSYNRTWIPKKAFNSEEEIKESFGSGCNIYKCEVCSCLHVASWPDTRKQ